MTDPANQEMQVERYLANRMTDDEVARFEQQLLASTELQDEVELALAIKQAMPHDAVRPGPKVPATIPTRKWQPLALAASVSLAVLTSYLYVDQRKDNIDLRTQLELADQPNANVTIVPVRIFRSSTSLDPNPVADVVVRKPAVGGVVILDIELDSQTREQPNLSAKLADSTEQELASWSIQPGSQSTRISLPVERIPDGMLKLAISGDEGTVLRTHWIEFLPAQ
jgi:hypothetical protein